MKSRAPPLHFRPYARVMEIGRWAIAEELSSIQQTHSNSSKVYLLKWFSSWDRTLIDLPPNRCDTKTSADPGFTENLFKISGNLSDENGIFWAIWRDTPPPLPPTFTEVPPPGFPFPVLTFTPPPPTLTEVPLFSMKSANIPTCARRAQMILNNYQPASLIT
ncbi:hypothetical protein QQP08_026106 [Theobroma cacao]|nr:hypothetical protein QQP08_026106 [Theobroma cacao]